MAYADSEGPDQPAHPVLPCPLTHNKRILQEYVDGHKRP